MHECKVWLLLRRKDGISFHDQFATDIFCKVTLTFIHFIVLWWWMGTESTGTELEFWQKQLKTFTWVQQVLEHSLNLYFYWWNGIYFNEWVKIWTEDGCLSMNEMRCICLWTGDNCMSLNEMRFVCIGVRWDSHMAGWLMS